MNSAQRERPTVPLASVGIVPGTRPLYIDLAPANAALDLHWIDDELLRAGVHAAIVDHLLPSATESAYPGHFNIVADGSAFGGDASWPGLDSWQMAGAYLLIGRRRLVLDYFDFVIASQRYDGNIPFAIFPADPSITSQPHLRQLRDPQDAFVYEPPDRADRPAGMTWTARRWIGLFEHWQPRANPLSLLGAVSFLLTAQEIFADEPDEQWLLARLASLDRAGNSLLSQRQDNGLIAGSGYYVEMPPRYQFDGVAQCYVCFAWRMLAELCAAAGERERQAFWLARAVELEGRSREQFWRTDHFIEYIHPRHGPVDSHGLSDVNWAAIGLGVASDQQARLAMTRMTEEPRLWRGGMPTQLVADPFGYQDWELHEPLAFTPGQPPSYDASAMGRVWYLEALACRKMGHTKRLRESMRLVCDMGRRHGWRWHERYRPQPDGSVIPAGPPGYCEYPAILVRIVFAMLRGS